MNLRQPAKLSSLAFLAIVLAACGGGGSTSDGSTGGGGGTSSALRLRGVASTGAALANAAVAVNCATGTKSGAAGADGQYDLTLDTAQLPCIVQATSSDGSTKLHSVLAGTTTDATVHLTSLTELVTAATVADKPTAAFDNFSAAASKVTSANISTANTEVKAIATAAGLNLTGVTDLIGGTLGTAGTDAYGTALTTLGSKLAASGTTLATVTNSVVSAVAAGGSTADITTTAAATVSTALQPISTASACPALKGGKYRLINPIDFAGTFNLVTVNTAVSPISVTDGDGVTVHALTETSPCRFSVSNTGGVPTELLVSPSSAAVILSGAPANVVIALPDQTLPLSVLAGDWLGVGLDIPDTSFLPVYNLASLDAAGALTHVDYYYGGAKQFSGVPQPAQVLTAHPSGGFVSNGGNHRVFGYVTPAGEAVGVSLWIDGSLSVNRKQTALILPAVGKTNSFWNFSVNSAGVVSGFSEDTVTVDAVDSTAGSITRSFTSDGHHDTLSFNQPINGFRTRLVNTCTTSTGAAMNCNGVVQMPFPALGMTLGVSTDTTKVFMSVSIDKP